MHNAAFQALGIDARYELFEIQPQKLEVELKNKLKQGVSGLNVTIPYKEKVIQFLDHIDEEADLIGAVNTVKIDAGGESTGFNTDGRGFITHLKEAVGFDPKGKAAAVLGAGGAAKALTAILAKSKAKTISIFDIDSQKTKELIERLKIICPQCLLKEAKDANDLLSGEPDLLINATPIGMSKSDHLVFDPTLLQKKMVVYDLVYNPAQTPLLIEAKARGCAGVFNGLGMLLYQGVLAFRIWLEADPPIDVMEEALREVLTKT